MSTYEPGPGDVPVNPINCRAAVTPKGYLSAPAQCLKRAKIDGRWCKAHAPKGAR